MEEREGEEKGLPIRAETPLCSAKHKVRFFIYLLYFFFYVLAGSSGRLSSRAWWSALARHGAGSFVYSGTSYAWLMLAPGTHS